MKKEKGKGSEDLILCIHPQYLVTRNWDSDGLVPGHPQLAILSICKEIHSSVCKSENRFMRDDQLVYLCLSH